jgi:phage baseplate assembly protein W
MTTLAQRLGRGWGFPLAPDPANGRLAYAEGPEKVRQSILLILETEPGERVMRPDFGCGLRRFLAQPNTVAVRAEIQREIELSLAAWEPRIQLTEVDASPGDDPAEVEIGISYVHVRTQRPDSLLYVLPLS